MPLANNNQGDHYGGQVLQASELLYRRAERDTWANWLIFLWDLSRGQTPFKYNNVLTSKVPYKNLPTIGFNLGTSRLRSRCVIIPHDELWLLWLIVRVNKHITELFLLVFNHYQLSQATFHRLTSTAYHPPSTIHRLQSIHRQSNMPSTALSVDISLWNYSVAFLPSPTI